MIKPFFSGIGTGMVLQLAIGPVFFYILGITLDSGLFNSFLAVLAVTLADYLYILLSLAGIGSLLTHERIKNIFGIISSMVLILFGIFMAYKGLVYVNAAGASMASLKWSPLNSFTSAFLLTLSSPLTIVFWTSVFSAKAIEKNYKKNELIAFALGTGMATFLFLFPSMAVLSVVKSGIPNTVVQVLNIIVGLVLIGYGFNRTVRLLNPLKKLPDSH